ncbi:hypothetical protein B0J14DRAFT_696183 [Halenospora varia]|nr:hypothetical protein B0J14DRAFT_696183 [Halenospora varia]
MIRTVQKFTLGAYLALKDSPRNKYTHFPFSIALVDEYRSLTESQTPAMLLFKMYECLDNYDASFERHETLRQELMFDYEWVCEQELKGNFGPEETPYDSAYLDRTRVKLKTSPRRACLVSGEDKSEVFVEARAEVIAILEPLYRRIIKAAMAAGDFVKKQKQRGGLLNPNYSTAVPDEQKLLAAEGVLLEEYAKSFSIDTTFSNRIIARASESRRAIPFSQDYRELTLKLLRDSLSCVSLAKAPSEEIVALVNCFKDCMNDMDRQYLNIRECRKALYSFDGDQLRSDRIDFESGSCDEMVDWKVFEPCMKLKTRPHLYGSW